MTLSNLRGLHDPVRTEREAVLEAENARLRGAAAEVVRQGNAESIYIEALLRAIDGLISALSTTASKGGADELCEGCPPVGYPTEKTRCLPCPRRASKGGGDE